MDGLASMPVEDPKNNKKRRKDRDTQKRRISNDVVGDGSPLWRTRLNNTDHTKKLPAVSFGAKHAMRPILSLNASIPPTPSLFLFRFFSLPGRRQQLFGALIERSFFAPPTL